MIRRHARAFLLGLLVSACSSLGDPTAVNRCSSEADCATGTCDTEREMCVGTTRTPLLVGLEVVPSEDPLTGGTGRIFSFAPFELDGPAERDLHLPPSVALHGRVTDGRGLPITAEVTFSTTSAIPGAPGSSIASQARGETTYDERSGGFEYNFSTQLLPGRVYDVVVRPNGEWAAELPPLRAVYMTPEGSAHRLELSYPSACSIEVMNDPTSTESCLATVAGFIRDGSGDPLDGFAVRVVDPVTGQTLSSSFTTGSGTEPVPGWFEVTLPIERWRDQEGWLFRIAPTAQRIEEHGPVQTFTVGPSALYEDDLGNVTIRVPEVPDLVEYAGWVEGPDGTPARGANLQFISGDVVDEVTGALGSFSATATTNDEGQFSVTLLALGEVDTVGGEDGPGTYSIIITPSQGEPAQAEMGIYSDERSINPERPPGLAADLPIPVMGQLFELPLRALYSGPVKTAAGEGMLNANVRAQARGGDFGGELPASARYARSNSALTDMNGAFRLGLDVGVYDIVVEPPAGSNFPWYVLPNQPVARDFAHPVELESPVLVSGVAAFADAEGSVPVANGEVRAYAVIETSSGGTRAVQIGRATTDADGNYTLLLPPSL